jgi:diguanylate cyclase (GGDEF)-like protein
MRVQIPGGGSDPGSSMLAVPRRTALLRAYTTFTIVAGGLALIVPTLLLLLVPAAGLRPTIAIPGVPEPWGAVAGVAAWTLFALVGGTRILKDTGGHMSLSLHLPFIAAAMTLGGPVAGAWVAALGTFDRRELREAPWYGVLANHAALVLAAVAGGLVVEAILGLGRLAGVDGGQVMLLVAALAGTGVTAVASALQAAITVVLRDGLEPAEVAGLMDQSFRRTSVAEAVLGWVFVVVWLAVGWWAPILCTVLVLTVWRAADNEDQLDHDDLTGVLSRRAFALRAAQAADRARRGVDGAAYLYLDLDDFKMLNDGPRSHHVGDQVLTELGARLRRCVRVTDAVGRRGGDEFLVLFNGVRDEDAALILARRVLDAVTAPYATDDGPKAVGASIGVALARPGRRDFEPDLRLRADTAMYQAKEAGGGIRIWREPDEGAAPAAPFAAPEPGA